MKPVTQTILHGDPTGVPGNCLQAAVASLLDLPLGDVPHFILHDDWLERLAAFCIDHGYQPIMRMPDVPVAYGMAWGPSVRGVRHAVVWVDGEIAWDPHPSRAGLLKVTELIAFEPIPAALSKESRVKPSVGRTVHYVSYGTPGGEYSQECRAAIITELTGGPNHPDQVGLAVLNPTGMFFNRAVEFHDGAETVGAADCPDSESHGSPFRYCACGWAEASHKGGTWHWPEHVEE